MPRSLGLIRAQLPTAALAQGQPLPSQFSGEALAVDRAGLYLVPGLIELQLDTVFEMEVGLLGLGLYLYDRFPNSFPCRCLLTPLEGVATLKARGPVGAAVALATRDALERLGAIGALGALGDLGAHAAL